MKVENRSALISPGLIDKCIANDRAAQKDLYENLLPYLASVSRRYLVNTSDLDDALQNSFVNIFRHIDQYDSDKGSFKTWAVKITINSSLKLNEKMYKLKTTEFENGAGHESIEPVIYDDMNNDEMIEFLQGMPNSWFQVFNLFVVEGFSHKEIGELLSIDESLSRQRLSRARKWLKDRLVTEKGERKIKSFM